MASEVVTTEASTTATSVVAGTAGFSSAFGSSAVPTTTSDETAGV